MRFIVVKKSVIKTKPQQEITKIDSLDNQEKRRQAKARPEAKDNKRLMIMLFKNE